jgi:hypothetical protein
MKSLFMGVLLLGSVGDLSPACREHPLSSFAAHCRKHTDP